MKISSFSNANPDPPVFSICLRILSSPNGQFVAACTVSPSTVTLTSPACTSRIAGHPVYTVSVPCTGTGVFFSIYSFRILENNSSFRIVPPLFSFSSAIIDIPQDLPIFFCNHRSFFPCKIAVQIFPVNRYHTRGIFRFLHSSFDLQ